MPIAGSVIELITAILVVVNRIMMMVERAHQNKEMCNLLKERVRLIAELLKQLKATGWTPDPASHMMLSNLSSALDSAEQLVHACQRKKSLWKKPFSTGEKAKRFHHLHTRIDYSMQHFHITNLIVVLSLNHEGFFMKVLDKLLRRGACKHLSPREKDDIRKDIGGLGYRDHMSPNAKMMLELIISDLSKEGSAATWTSSVNQGGGGRGESMREEIQMFARDIVHRAATLNEVREVQWLAQLAQRVLHLMQHPRAPQMMRHPEGPQMVEDLWRDLEEARDLVRYNHPHGCGVPTVFSNTYSTLQAISIYKVGYKIEHCLQVLPIVTMRQTNYD